MASELSPEERELQLIGRLEFRIAAASSDEKLETILDKFLAALLLKLGSENIAARNKVISICQHINKRIMPPQEIKLPVKKLLTQYKENADVALIRHFDIMYIQQGIIRVPVSERLDLLPILVNGIAKDYAKSAQHASQLFHLTLRLLTHFKLPLRGSKEDGELREKLQMNDEDAKFLSHWFGKLLLLAVVRQNNADGPAPRCPGLSVDEYKFLTQFGKPDAWDPAAQAGLNLTETKALVARCLASGMFTDNEKLLPALYASADTNSRIFEIGDDVLKRVMQATDLEDQNLIEGLLDLYFGSSSSEGALPAKTPLRIKILGLFSRSVRVTAYPQQVSKIVEEGLLSADLGTNAQSTAGREASRFRSAIFALVNFVARRGSKSDLQSIAQGLVGNLRAFIEDQGWPAPDRDSDSELRRYGYETIGLLAKASSETILLEPSLDLLSWLFRSLKEDSSGRDVAVSIEEALSSVLGGFAGPLDPEVENRLRQTLLKYSTADSSKEVANADKFSRNTRYVATRFANGCLPYVDVLARWINIVAISGGSTERHEVIEEGKKGLDPYLFSMSRSFGSGENEKSMAFPNFDELVDYIFSRRPESEDGVDMDIQDAPVAQVRAFQNHFAHTLPAVINYCTQVAIHTALNEKSIQSELSQDWGRKLETLLTTDQRSRQAFRAFAAEDAHSRSFALLLRACFEQITQNELNDIGDLGDTFVSLCALCPEAVWKEARLLHDFQALLPSILSNNAPRRSGATHAYGLLASHTDSDVKTVEKINGQLIERLKDWQSAVGGEINQISGAIVALSYFFSRKHWRDPESDGLQHIGTLLQVIVDILKTSSDATLKAAVFSCLDQLSLFQIITASKLADYAKFRDVVEKVFDSAKSGITSAVLALGHLSMTTEEGDIDQGNETDYAYLAEKFYELHEVRQPEVQFSVGEALSCFAIGWDTKALAAELDVEHPEQTHHPWDAEVRTPQGPIREKTLSTVLEKTLKGCRQTKPSLKKASVIWLLCLLQYCGHKPEIQGYLPQCQTAFKICLTDRDEVVQEAASRGLGIVYEKGDRQLKDDLVRDLVGSFSDNKASISGTVSEDTQLFEPGALPTGDGSITTYKDILNLASEVGDSSLVYRFMSLASNNSIWSSRAAFGRFGLSNIFSDSSVDGYLAENPKLYPKLYRYRFDPNTNVQRSMNDIWNALVKDSSATIDKHFDAIMNDLLTSILNKEWRVRQASCAAISDLVQGRRLEKYEKFLDQVWDKCFKVLDDIKESVRAAAASLARVLTALLTRSLEAGDSSTKTASAMLSRVLPFLLSSSGLESSAEDVRTFAVVTLLQIVKKSSAKTLNPHSPELVERLLGLLSSLEPEAINYIHLNASKYNLTEQKLDDMRLQSVRASPLTESIERCLDLADADTMKTIVPRVESAMKSAVGLPSKVGCSRILVTLSTRHNFLFKPYADGFMKLIQKYVYDRNETVSSSYAAAAGYVARLASDKQLLSSISFCHKLYFESDDEKSRLAAGDIILSISKNATDRFNSLASELLPFIFLAKHDSHSVVKQLFSDTWSDNVAGSRSVLLYLKEIMALADKHLESQKWVLKHTSAKTVADAIMSITSGTEDMDKANATIVWPSLDKAIGGKTWEGKEIVLEAFVRFTERGKSLWTADAKVAKQIEKVAIREAKRQNKAYRPFALEALGKTCRARDDLELSQAVTEIVESVLDEYQDGDEDGDKMDVDGGEVLKDVALQEKTISACISALSDAPNPNKLSPTELADRLTTILPLIAKANSTRAKDIHLKTFTSLLSLFERVPADLPLSDAKAKEALEKVLFDPTFEGLPEAMRLKRAEALVAIAKVKQCAWVVEKLKPEVGGGERSAAVRNVLAKAG
ncbi:ARM repeat-containing protein [Aaosphaeria arxii CBS 175.79]|uniref:ARM repeat-containing protein n=1 Tax=Aaosphaeria arxii CBS 175.79 TaxID=1450172 RepID=A0A6A5XSP8_9PLEO|nr:ARM repeat-containing protein [Aaosphaeria arxii CBS 175.79]KAF2015929.1 ARM repeat-containing protein [Aaosphaeria arxii CBS 175.79]